MSEAGELHTRQSPNVWAFPRRASEGLKRVSESIHGFKGSLSQSDAWGRRWLFVGPVGSRLYRGNLCICARWCIVIHHRTLLWSAFTLVKANETYPMEEAKTTTTEPVSCYGRGTANSRLDHGLVLPSHWFSVQCTGQLLVYGFSSSPNRSGAPWPHCSNGMKRTCGQRKARSFGSISITGELLSKRPATRISSKVALAQAITLVADRRPTSNRKPLAGET
jgi:hypothetical protein